MPVNEGKEGIFSKYDLNNPSLRQYLSQTVSGNQPITGFNQWVSKPNQRGPQLHSNWRSNSLEQPDSVDTYVGKPIISPPFHQTYTPLTSIGEYNNLSVDNSSLANDLLVSHQNLKLKENDLGCLVRIENDDQQLLTTSRSHSVIKSQLENECADSPTLTTNSERSEVTEASGDFNAFRGQQQLVVDQQLCAQQSYSMQQSGYTDFQLLQQQMLYKQLQEFQRQQQFQQLSDARQQSPFNQFSSVAKQASGGQFTPFINGMPVNDASLMLRSLMQRGASPAAQGGFNKSASPQEQAHLTGLSGQQPDGFNTKRDINQYANFQRISQDSNVSMAKSTVQAHGSMTQSSSLGNPYLHGQLTVPQDNVGLYQGAPVSRQGTQMTNRFGQISAEDPNHGLFPGNLMDGTPQANLPYKTVEGQQEQQAAWSAAPQTTKQLTSSQGLVPLDPLEAKILYNMDGNIWDGFGSRPDIPDGGSSGTSFENPDSLNAFPSLQSGSWSALMQSAVAEASSSETGPQEEWSGVSFQNTEHSTDNHVSNFMDSGDKQQSFSSKLPTDNASGMNPTFPGFQQAPLELPVGEKEAMLLDSPHDSSSHQSSRMKPSAEAGQKVQPFGQLEGGWTAQMFGHSQSELHHQRAASDTTSVDQHQGSGEKSQQQTAETYEMLQNSFQRENPNDCNTNNPLSSHDQVYPEQFNKFSGNGSYSVNMEGSLPSFPDSIVPEGSSGNSQSSDHGAEVHPKVGTFGSSDCSRPLEIPRSDSNNASFGQPYLHSSAAQGFGLRLAPPTQRLSNPNNVFSPQGYPMGLSNLNSRISGPAGDKNQSWLGHPSLQPVAHSISGQAVFSSNLNVHGNPMTVLMPTPSHTKDQFQVHPVNDVSVASQSSQAPPTNHPGRLPHLIQTSSQDLSQLVTPKAAGQPYQHLEKVPLSETPTMHNVWRNVPTQRQQFGMELPKISSTLTNNNAVSSLGAEHIQSNNQISSAGGYKSMEMTMSSDLQESAKDISLFPSSSAGSYPSQQDLDKVKNKAVHASLEKGTEDFKHSHDQYHRHAILHQMQTVRNLPGSQNSALQPNSMPPGDTNVLSYMTLARDGLGTRASLPSALQAGSSLNMVQSGHNDSQSQSSSINVLSNHGDNSQFNQHMSPSWLRQFSALKNGQMVPMFDSRLAMAAALQFSLGKQSQNLHVQSSLEHAGAANAGQASGVQPSLSASLSSVPLGGSYVVPYEKTNQISPMRPKKRKLAISDALPWHKEVGLDCGRPQNISISEEEWARAANRLFEKVEDVVDMMKPMHPRVRAKRRLVLARKLMQQLFRPGPASLWTAECSSNYSVLSYIISRLSLGDACGLASTTKCNMTSEKPDFCGRSDLRYLSVVEELIGRAKKLEQDFLRMEKTGTIVDMRVEFEDVERHGLVNRFAKFYMRGQTDAASGISSSSSSGVPRALPQRYVMVSPMPRNLLEEGAECISL